jgi:hypothetical protein
MAVACFLVVLTAGDLLLSFAVRCPNVEAPIHRADCDGWDSQTLDQVSRHSLSSITVPVAVALFCCHPAGICSCSCSCFLVVIPAGDLLLSFAVRCPNVEAPIHHADCDGWDSLTLDQVSRHSLSSITVTVTGAVSIPSSRLILNTVTSCRHPEGAIAVAIFRRHPQRPLPLPVVILNAVKDPEETTWPQPSDLSTHTPSRPAAHSRRPFV